MTSTTRFYHPTTVNLSAIRTSWLVEPRETPASIEFRRRALKTSNVKPAYVSYKNAGPTGFGEPFLSTPAAPGKKLTYAAGSYVHAKLPMLMEKITDFSVAGQLSMPTLKLVRSK
ncbi:hypothetical protein BC829DRAFT_435219 [Chytridium lagenaria]|nr:hypothetical protein BC829DRAFT_435219 [Chytridium lagenaria]